MTTPIRRRTALKASLAAVGSAAVAAVLAACGESTVANTPQPAAATARPTTAGTIPSATTAASAIPAATGGTSRAGGLDPSQKVTIEYWQIQNTAGAMAVRDLLTRFSTAYPNVSVMYRDYPGYDGIVTAIQAAAAAKTSPAIAAVGYPWLKYAARNLPHTTIDDAVRRDGGEGAGWLTRNFAPNILELSKVDGTLHGLPYALSNPILFLNNDLLMQAGLERAPQTWGELRDHARRIKERTGKFGFYMTEAPGYFADQALVESNGARMLVGTGADVRTGIDSPEAIEAIQLIADMVLKDKTAATMSSGQGDQNFVSGEFGMTVQSIASLNSYSQGAKFAVGTAPFPTFGPKPRRVPIGGNALFMFATDATQQAAAWEFMKFLYAPESITTWVKGTSYLPPSQGVTDDARYLKPFFDENPRMRAATGQIADAVQFVSWPGKDGLQASKELVDARAKILSGNQDAATALRGAAQRVNALIKG